MKRYLLISLCLLTLTSGCAAVQIDEKQNDSSGKQPVNSRSRNEASEDIEISKGNVEGLSAEVERIFVDLEFLGEMKDTNYRMRYISLDPDPEDEFTWWNHYTVDEYIESSKYYNFILPDGIDKKKHDIILSFGRKLKYLYYYEQDYLSDPDWELEGYRARPIFEEEFTPSNMNVYLIDKIPLADSELASKDMTVFLEGCIPVKLPLIEDEINRD